MGGRSKHIFDLPITCLPPLVKKLESGGGDHFGGGEPVGSETQAAAGSRGVSFPPRGGGGGVASPLDQTQVLKQRCNSGFLSGVPED